MLANERLTKITVSAAYANKLSISEMQDMAQELLSARTRIAALETEAREWREDSERLARFAIDTNNHQFGEIVMMTQQGEAHLMEICKQHTSLVEKYGKA